VVTSSTILHLGIHNISVLLPPKKYSGWCFRFSKR